MDSKPGYKTTEFWLAAIAALVGLFVGSGVLPTDHAAMKIAGFVLSALATAGYSWSRAAVKKSAAATEIKEPDWAKDDRK